MKRIGLTVILSLLLLINASYAQRKISFPFSGGYDEEAEIQIGIQYNFLKQDYQLTLKNNWQVLYGKDTDPQELTYLGELKAVSSKSGQGFSFGIPVDFKLSDIVYANFTPTFAVINGLSIRYTSTNPEIAPIVRKSKQVVDDLYGDNFTAFEFPIALKLRSEEKKVFKTDVRYRGYLLGGIRYSRWAGAESYYATASNSIDSQSVYSPSLVLRNDYIAWEAGLGFDIYFSFFKMSPEIRFSQSVNNIFDNNHLLAKDNKFMKPLDKGLIRNVYFSLIFQ